MKAISFASVAAAAAAVALATSPAAARDPIRIVTTPDGARLLVQPATGRDCTAPMRDRKSVV